MARPALVEKQDAILKGISPSRSKSASIISFPPVNAKTDDNYSEIEVVEIPVFKRMVFQFNKLTKLEFSMVY